MANLTIFLLSSDKHIKEQFRDQLSGSGYRILLFDDINDVIKNIPAENPLLVLIDYDTIVSSDRKAVIDLFKIIRINQSMVFNVPQDTDRRIAFYELGATRVFDRSYTFENISSSVQWLLNLLTSIDERQQLFSKGKLEDIPLTSLIDTLGKESRSGVLKIVTANNSGKIYFNEGDITHAEVGFHKGENAVIQMLLWDKGTFSFSSLKKEAPAQNVSATNPGLKILADHYGQEYRSRLQKLGTTEATVRIQNEGDLLATISDLDNKFVEFLKRPQTLGEILENPYYTSFETVEKLLQLKNQNFLVIKEPVRISGDETKLTRDLEQLGSSEETAIKLSAKNISMLRQKLEIRKSETGKVVVFTFPESAALHFFESIVSLSPLVRKDKQYMVGRLALGEALSLVFIVMSIGPRVMASLQELTARLNAQIFLLDTDKELDIEYLSYIIRQIFALNKIPTTVAIAQTSGSLDIKALQKKFNLPKAVQILTFDPSLGEMAMQNILLAMEKVFEEPEKTSGVKEVTP